VVSGTSILFRFVRCNHQACYSCRKVNAEIQDLTPSTPPNATENTTCPWFKVSMTSLAFFVRTKMVLPSVRIFRSARGFFISGMLLVIVDLFSHLLHADSLVFQSFCNLELYEIPERIKPGARLNSDRPVTVRQKATGCCPKALEQDSSCE